MQSADPRFRDEPQAGGHAQLPEAVRRLYPWPGQYLRVQGGHRLHYLDEGAGETVLMVHGNPTWSFYYRGLVRALATEGYRCIVPDHIGCGLSDKPQDWPYRLEDHVRNLDQLITDLDLRDITLVVHDWGGAIGLGALMKHPERLRRLVVFNTSVFEGPLPLRIRMCRWPSIGAVSVRGVNGFLKIALRVGFAKPVTADVTAGYLAPYGSWEDRVAIHRFVQDIPLEPDHVTRPLIDALDRYVSALRHVPTLIVWGERDFVFTKEYLTGWRTRLPEAEVHSLPHGAHFVVEDAHGEIVDLLRDFLARHPLARPEQAGLH